ncbi:hypothetical protein G6F31_017600 [Rhizopus arrhizus]|nr:hypothetical protein G6F31_017600 [Rhizopus arrhizus]
MGAEPDIRVELPGHHGVDHGGKQQVHRERSQELRDGLHALRISGTQPDPYRDRHPDDRGQGYQQHDPDHRDATQAQHVQHLAPAHVLMDEHHHLVRRQQGRGRQQGVPDAGPARIGHLRPRPDGGAVIRHAEPPQRTAHARPERVRHRLHPAAAPRPVQQPRLLRGVALRFLEPELVGPGQQWPEEELAMARPSSAWIATAM